MATLPDDALVRKPTGPQNHAPIPGSQAGVALEPAHRCCRHAGFGNIPIPHPLDKSTPMKNLKTPMALAILLATAPAVNAADLTITGEIKDTTCTAAIGGGVAIDMGSLDLTDLNGSDRIGGRDLDVSVSCPGASGSQDVAVKFSGISTSDGGLSLTAASTAKGVSYKIYDVAGDQLPINSAPAVYVRVDGTSAQVIKHSVWYAKTGADDAEAGSAIANAQMDIIYK
ncbi:fimbrial protein [Stenotrophomonas maltophilia]|uniref:fimbrial protein n=1 Tax=Stenotrophomonas maltophilia TaxID=40324 RepID=UPI0013747545|nr:fimbrial protein [Stenotrophomonas maltophilia]